ncbi:MAG TPA: hypothetical protein PKY30_16705, partial [Myxococcota bacterium]|nr:hypothetical protein [Myxococcota bacterium]
MRHLMPQLAAFGLLLLPSLAAAAGGTYGPFRADIPAGFSVSRINFVDQDPNSPGTQVDVWVVQGGGHRVEFETDDAVNSRNNRPAGWVTLGRSYSSNDNGTIRTAGVSCGTLWATGVDTRNADVVWTPSFNGSSNKGVARYRRTQDQDADRLTAADELVSYCTSPVDADTDGGSVDDGTEILQNGTDPLSSGDDLII